MSQRRSQTPCEAVGERRAFRMLPVLFSRWVLGHEGEQSEQELSLLSTLGPCCIKEREER